MVQDSVLDGKMNPEYPPDGVEITFVAGYRFAAKYSSGLYGTYSGEIVISNGQTLIKMVYSDKAGSYTANCEAVLMNSNLIEGRMTDNRKKTMEFRWSR